MKTTIFGFGGLVLALVFFLSGPALAIKGDLVGDNYIDWSDVGAFSDRWLEGDCLEKGWCGGADIDRDSNVGFADFGLLAQYWLDSDVNLVGWWKLDETLGVVAFDSSSNGNHGDLISEASWVPTSGIMGGAVSFGSTAEDAVQIPTTGMSASRGTISLWGWLERGTQTGYRFFFGVKNNAGNRIQLYMDLGRKLDLGLGDSHFKHSDIYEFKVETWYHIALTWNGSNYGVYVNGNKKAGGTYMGLDVLEPIAQIGNNGDAKVADRTQGFHGFIDDVRIWNRVLDADEIKYICEMGSPEPVFVASSPNPGDEATDVDVDWFLIWSAGYCAASHDVYLSTDFNDVNDANNSWPVAAGPNDPNVYKGDQADTTFEPGGFEYGTTYYWRIDEVNDVNIWGGEVWRFTTELKPPLPGQASSPSPANEVNDVSVFAALGWTMGSYATSHDVYFGSDFNDVNAANDSWPVAAGPNDPNVYKGNHLATIFNPGTMDANTLYYWRIDEKNVAGTTAGNIRQFTTEEVPSAAEKATNPSPLHQVIDVDMGYNLSWTAGDGATSHDVYFGTDSTPDAGEFQGNQTGTTFDPGIMDVNTTYYWRIDEKNAAGTTTGDVWRFTTQEYVVGTQYDLGYWDVAWREWDPCDDAWKEWDLDGSKRTSLNDFNGVHPRYLLTQADVDELKIKISDPNYVHYSIWNDIVKPKADFYVERVEQGLDPPSAYDSEEPMRSAGRGIPWIALAYLLTDEPNYLAAAEQWMSKVCSYPHWHYNWSLGAGECIFGVSVGYDWLYDDLTEPNKTDIRNKLIEVATDMNEPWGLQQCDRYLSNHCHVEHSGLGAAGFVLYDEVPEAMGWIRRADLIFQASFRAGSQGGSSTSGHQYWGYSMESLLCFTEAAKDLMDTDYYSGNNWLKNSANFIIFSTIPDFDMLQRHPGYSDCVMSFGDSHRDYRSHGPVHFLNLLASRYDNGFAQWLADRMFEEGIGITDEHDFRAWANLLWYDEDVQPVPIANLSTFRHFDDIGWVTSRSGWDEDAVMVGFKCSPMHGHKLQPYYDWQIDDGWPSWPYYHYVVDGHCHPDVDSFQIYAYGKWLVTEPGYIKPKWTKDHSTILAGGVGQLGEGGTWFNRVAVMDAKAKSSIIKAESTTDYDYIIGDAENIYRDPNLTKFLRHFVYIKPDIVLVVDELEASTAPDYFEWRLRTTHERFQFIDDMNIVEQDPNEYYIIENNNDSDVVVMDVHFIRPGLAGFSVGTEGDKFLKVNFDSTGSDLLATVLHPRRDEELASSITSSSFVAPVLSLTIQCGSRTINVELNLTTQEVNIF